MGNVLDTDDTEHLLFWDVAQKTGKMGERGADLTILLVEDNPGDIRLVEEALQGIDSSLYVTRDGKEALDFLQQQNEFSDVPRLDIVLLDLNLPKVDGTQVLEEIRSDPHSITFG